MSNKQVESGNFLEEQKEFIESLPDEFPIKILFQELGKANVESRIQSIQNLTQIAWSLGEVKSRIFLIPIIQELIAQEDKQVIIELINQIPKLVFPLGGQEFSSLLLDIIVHKLQEKDITYTSILVQSFQDILKLEGRKKECNKEKLLLNYIYDILGDEPDLESKEIILQIIPDIYVNSQSEIQQELLNIVQDFSKDQIPMVRQLVVQNLPKLIESIKNQKDKIEGIQLKEFFESIFNQLIQDEQDYVKELILQSLLKFIQFQQGYQQFIDPFQYIEILSENQSQKIQCSFINEFKNIHQILDYQLIQDKIIPLIKELATSGDKDSKILFLKSLQVFIENLGTQKFMELFKDTLLNLVQEKNIHVKSNVGEGIFQIFQGYQSQNQKQQLGEIKEILELWIKTMDKEGAYKFLLKLNDFDLFNSEVCIYILGTIKIVYQNKKWRLKTFALQKLSQLIQSLQISEMDEIIKEILLEGLQNSIFQVRNDSCIIVQDLLKNNLKENKLKYFTEQILGQFDQIKEHKNGLIRQNYGFILQIVLKQLNQQELNEYLDKFLKILFEDKVLNSKIVGLDIIRHFIEKQRDIEDIENNNSDEKEYQQISAQQIEENRQIIKKYNDYISQISNMINKDFSKFNNQFYESMIDIILIKKKP